MCQSAAVTRSSVCCQEWVKHVLETRRGLCQKCSKAHVLNVCITSPMRVTLNTCRSAEGSEPSYLCTDCHCVTWSPLLCQGFLCSVESLLETSVIKQVMRSSSAQRDLLHADTLVVGCLTAAVSKMRVK